MRKSLSDHILWNECVAPGIVGLNNGGYMRSYALLPPAAAVMSDSDKLSAAEQSNDAFRRLRDAYGLHIEEQYRPVDAYSPPAQWPTLGLAALDAEREKACRSKGAQFEARHFLTITSRPKSATASRLGRWLFTGPKTHARGEELEVEEFARLCDDVKTQLSRTVSLRELSDNQTASYLLSTVTHRHQDVVAKAHPKFGLQLPVEPVEAFWRVVRIGTQYVRLICLAGFDSGTSPQMLETLDVRFPMRRVTRWLPMGRGDARGLLRDRQVDAAAEAESLREAVISGMDKRHQPRESMKDPQAVKDAAAMQSAATALDQRGYGLLTVTFVVYDESASACADKAEDLQKQIAGAGLVAQGESLTTWGTWLGTVPGHLDPGVRKWPMTTRHLADLAPGTKAWGGPHHDESLVKRTKVKRPLMYFADPQPFRFSTHADGGAAHMLMLGATGQSGKSTLLNHLGAQFFGNPDAQVISLSTGRSELGTCLLSGGAVYAVNAKRSPLAFQPLAHVHDESERRFAAGWLEARLASLGQPVTPQQREHLRQALDMLSKDKPGLRTVTELRKKLRGIDPDLHLALQPFSRDGSWGHVFDGNDAGALKWARWTMFDISGVVGLAADLSWVTEAVNGLLLHMMRSRFDGRPTLVLADEVQRTLRFDSLADALTRILDEDRKNLVRLYLATQTPGALAKYPRLCSSLVSACDVKLYGRDPSAKVAKDSYAGFGVSGPECEHIARFSRGDWLFKSSSGSRKFNLAPGPIALAMTGGSSPADIELYYDLHAKCGGDPDEMFRELVVAKKLELKLQELRRWVNKSRKVA